MEKGKTTPGMMWRYGDDFRKAAECVVARYDDRTFAPYFFLIGQSIELLLKSFLMKKGLSVAVLRNKPFGHDLKAIMIEALRRDLEALVVLELKHKSAIDLLGLEYVVKRFQYVRTGMKVAPDTALIQEAANRLAVGLVAFCGDDAMRG